jgi:hypothetical protein
MNVWRENCDILARHGPLFHLEVHNQIASANQNCQFSAHGKTRVNVAGE